MYVLQDEDLSLELTYSYRTPVNAIDRERTGRQSVPLGGVSVLCTSTMPFLTSERLTRLSANDTHCPASALSTRALIQVSKCQNVHLSIVDGNPGRERRERRWRELSQNVDRRLGRLGR